MIEIKCLRALMMRHSWVLASYSSIMLSLHTFHSIIYVFIAQERKPLPCIPGKQVLTRRNRIKCYFVILSS